MKTILAFMPDTDSLKCGVFEEVLAFFTNHGNFAIIRSNKLDTILQHLEINSRICCVLYDFDSGGLELCDKVQEVNPDLPIFSFTDKNTYLEVDLRTLKLNLHFINYKMGQAESICNRIISSIDEYTEELIPPFTNALFTYASKNTYSYCTPGHADGTAFLQSPLGTLFYDFYGPNLFKSDLSVSMTELGSLLDHSGKHKQAEEYIAKLYGSDHCYIVTNGGSTSNKMIAMHVAYDGATVLVDRNCHKSITHVLMMANVYPIYLTPSRNWHGIIGGINREQLSTTSIDNKRQQLSNSLGVDLAKPIYAVITNSTYDGLLYNTTIIKNELDVPNIHFDAAWIPYTPFSPIYKDHYGINGDTPPNKIVYETFSSHKLLAALSQSAMLHVKGKNFNAETFSDSYMMHASTSPFYPIVASTETAAAMMNGTPGKTLINNALRESFSFRSEMERLREENESKKEGWFYHILQPNTIEKEPCCFKLTNGASWHGFQGDIEHMSLDPIKITLFTPGLATNAYDPFGIPACLVAKYLDYQGIVVEKTGPYSLLFLFGIGSDRSKSMKLLNELTSFKKAFDDNQKIEKILPNLYREAPRFYRRYSIQRLAEEIHQLYIENNLCEHMYKAYETLPDMVMTPYQARQHIIQNKMQKVPLEELEGKTCAEMILPYPPGIPLILPGEKIDKKSRCILDFLLTLCKIGAQYPGIETSIHGVTFDDNDVPFTHCIN